MNWLQSPAHIAIFTGVALPLVWWSVHYIARLWQSNQDRHIDSRIDAKLDLYVTSEEFDRRMAGYLQQQAVHHEQNRELLDLVRTDGIRREGIFQGSIEAARKENREDAAALRVAMDGIHKQLIEVLKLQGDRRQP